MNINSIYGPLMLFDTQKRLNKYDEQSSCGIDESYEQDSETQSVADNLPTENHLKVS